MTTPLDLGRAMLAGFQQGDLTMMVLSVLLLGVIAAWIVGILLGVLDVIDERRRNRQAAMRRHPSARTALAAMTPEEFHYHTSREWGR